MTNIIMGLFAHISFLLCIGMTAVVMARKSRRSQVQTAFFIILGFMMVWSAGVILEMDVRIATGKTYMLFINICYISICFTPVAILYLGKVILHTDWRPRPAYAALLIIPLASVIIVFTNPMHNLFFRHFSLYSDEAVYGAYYYFHTVYSYGCILLGIACMLIASSRNAGLFSMQSLFVVLGISITLIPNVMYSLDLVKLPFSISMVTFTVSILCFMTAFMKYRFITALPITLRDVVDLISDGYLVVDEHLHILAYNRALKRLFPEPVNIELGVNLRTFIDRYFTDTSYNSFLELNARAAENKETASEEMHLFGETYVSVEITPVIRRSAQIGSIILLKDITQSKLLIEETQAASRAKSDFLANMSHEIRTPMNAIIGMAAIGQSTADPERKDYCLTKINDASTHLLGVINDVLDMSKIEAGKFELSPVEYSFEKMIQRVVNIVSFRVTSKKQQFMVRIDGNVPDTLIGDDQRLAQVIANLLGNAVKFTPEHGSIKLDAQCMDEADGFCTIQISVADTGIGVSREQQGRLFQSFAQADTDTARKFGGTGLGLSISKNIVEMMGGRIWVESEPGQGSTFSFNYRAQVAAGKKEARTGPRANWDGIRVLVVDDDPDILSYFEEILKGLDIFCDTAENDEDALQLITREGAYDLYFVDWKMPGIDGINLTREIKTLTSFRRDSRVIIFSAADWSQIEEEARQAGVDGFLSKPLFPSSVSDIIDKFVGLDLNQKDNAQADINGIFAGRRVMFAEDIAINREIVLALLEPMGLEIDCAENGAEAVRMFKEAPERYEMIFMDVQMPQMDGYEATSIIRALDIPEAKTVPIIAMTANVFREDVEKCLAAGMDDHLGKPMDLNAVLEKLRTYLPAK